MFKYVVVSLVTRTEMKEEGGGLGLCIKYSIECKVRHYFNKIDESIKNLWIECVGNNCNKSYLIATLYQPSSNKNKKTDMHRKAWRITVYRKQHLK